FRAGPGRWAAGSAATLSRRCQIGTTRSPVCMTGTARADSFDAPTLIAFAAPRGGAELPWGGPAGDLMGPYLLRRLLIAVPSLLGISLVLFTVLALAPGDPFEELATNPAVPPEVRTALRIKFGLDDPIALRYLRWLVAMLAGDWGFSFVSRVDVGALIMQRLPTTFFVFGSSPL